MKMEINLTIIIPHYNTPSLLEKLINSIPELNDIQIIVVDDNSDKEFETFLKVKSIYSNRVEFYTNNTGIKGAGLCRNIGLDYAKGSWILFADADDYFLAGMYDKVQEYFDSDYDMVFFTPTSVYMDTGKLADRHVSREILIENYLNNTNQENMLALKSFGFGVPWSKLIKRELIEKYHVRFSQSLYSNDIVFSTVIGYYSRNIAASKEVIYCATRGKGTLTTCTDEKVYDIRLEETIKRYKFLIDHYGSKICKDQHLSGAEYLYIALQRHYGIKKYIQVIRKFKQSQIPIFDSRFLNPSYFFRALAKRIRLDKQNRNYLEL